MQGGASSRDDKAAAVFNMGVRMERSGEDRDGGE
jgi:hypothetical protein